MDLKTKEVKIKRKIETVGKRIHRLRMAVERLQKAKAKIEKLRLQVEGDRILSEKPQKKLPTPRPKKASRLEVEFARALGLREEDIDELRRSYQKHAN